MNVTERTTIWRIQSDLVDGKITSITAFSRVELVDDNGVVVATKDNTQTELPVSEKEHSDAADVLTSAIADKAEADIAAKANP